MKAFEFNIGNYEVKRNGDTLLIWELDHEQDRINVIPLEITLTDLQLLTDEAVRLQDYYNPACQEVKDARADLENARVMKVPVSKVTFEEALKAYMDISARHREAFQCDVFH